MRILGIDPGIEKVGFALLDVINGKKSLKKFGLIKTEKHKSKIERFIEIFDDLEKIITEFKPDYCAIEKIFFSNNVKTAITVSEAKGLILYCLAKHKIPVTEYTPSQMKSSVTGNGRADKASVQKMLMLELNLKENPKQDDAADALSLALALASELR